MERRWSVVLVGAVLGTGAWVALGQRELSTAGQGGVWAGFPPEVVASTTTTTTGVSYVTDDNGNLVGFYAFDPAVLVANADINGDGVNDMITVTVQPPLPPPFEAPASYQVNVTSGATGLTIHNYTAISPLWWEG